MAATVTHRATLALVGRPGTAALARQSGLHPELVRRLVSLGAVEPSDPEAAARLAQIVRLRRDLGLNYAGAILACELLARIERLEAKRWTPTG
jgi:chaperone modulatory protein CbpM